MRNAGKAPEGFSLRRWSQRKLAARDERTNAHARAPDAPAVARERQDSPAAVPDAAPPSQPVVADTSASPAIAGAESRPALPPVESLTFDSDFTPFMQSGVDENVRRSALRKLLRDPRFNVMDGLDTYIDDYSKPSPIEPEVVRTLWQARYLFDPPKTRVNAEGVVEDVPEQEAGTAGDAAAKGEALPVPEAAAAGNIQIPPEPLTRGMATDIAAERDDARPAAAVQPRDPES